MSTLAVVEAILREAAVPLSVREIVQRAGERLPTKSKTPDTVVARDLSMDIKRKMDASIFVRTSPGRYAIREQVMRANQVQGQAASTPVVIHADEGNGYGSGYQREPAEVVAPMSSTSVIGQSLSGQERQPALPAPVKTPGSSSGQMSA